MSRELSSSTAALLPLFSAAPALIAAADENPPPEPCWDTEDDTDRFVTEQERCPAAPHTQRLLRRQAEKLLQEAADLSAEASDTAESLEQEAARLFLLYQALTFQHQFLHQYSKRLAKLAQKKMSKRAGSSAAGTAEEDALEERLAEQQRMRMIFRGGKEEEESVRSLVSGLPPAWTVVQLSCVEQLAASRFKDTKRDETSKTTNPALCVLRVR